VRGILGENFLRHFDILFDNQHRTMTLDAADGLADSLTGERLPIIFPTLAPGDENRYQPMISAELDDYGRARLLLDSGATDFTLVQWGSQLKGSGDTSVTTVNGSLACESTNKRVYLGKGTVIDLTMVSCQSARVKPEDSKGVLPTGIFKQIFISHAGSYAIINPIQSGNVPREVAAVAPLPQ